MWDLSLNKRTCNDIYIILSEARAFGGGRNLSITLDVT